jgi:hypothetical protein
MLDGVHAVGAEELDLVAGADGVDISLSTALSARLAAEVVLENLLALGGHVTASVLADVLPGLADRLTIDLDLVEGVVGLNSGGQRQDGSSSLHFEGSDVSFEFEGVEEGLIEWNSSINEEGNE